VDGSPVVVVERSATDTAFANGLWAGRLEAATVAVGAAYLVHEFRNGEDEGEGEFEAEDGADYDAELRETRALMRTLEQEAADPLADPLIAAIERPADGTYAGETAEDDGGDQSATTTLRFDPSGSVTGDGVDDFDGAYTVDGRWAGKRVAWIEKYDEGFTVALRGQILPSGCIRALWASSRGIGGAVTLEAPSTEER